MKQGLQKYAQLDDMVLAEVNIKKIERRVAQTEKGELCLIYDGEQYFFELAGDGVEMTEGLEEIATEVLKGQYKQQ